MGALKTTGLGTLGGGVGEIAQMGLEHTTLSDNVLSAVEVGGGIVASLGLAFMSVTASAGLAGNLIPKGIHRFIRGMMAPKMTATKGAAPKKALHGLGEIHAQLGEVHASLSELDDVEGLGEVHASLGDPEDEELEGMYDDVEDRSR